MFDDPSADHFWVIDPDNTTVTVTAKAFLVTKVAATLRVIDGTATAGAEGLKVKAALDATSYDSGNNKRDHHVRSNGFFDSEHYPEISFSSVSVTETPEGYGVSGAVKMKGQVTPLTLHIDNVSMADETATFLASGTISRSGLGVDKAPSLLIGDEVLIEIDGVAVRAG